jgi:hypothetical protein
LEPLLSRQLLVKRSAEGDEFLHRHVEQAG